MSAIENYKNKLRLIGFALAGGVFVLDQLSKWWILNDIMQIPTVIRLTSFFNIVLAWNSGISFGMFDSGSTMGAWVLVGIAVVIIIFLTIWLMRGESMISVVAIGLIIGGAAGNVVDRIRFGAVADFLDFHIGSSHWPAFNVADAAITMGAVALILEALKPDPEEPKNNDQQDETTNQTENQ